MSETDPGITLGIEEEFFLVDPESRDLLSDPDRRIFEACERNRGPHNAVPEFLRSQIETGTKVCRSVAEVRQALRETRRLVIEAAAEHGAAVMAASTHPFAAWRAQMVTPRERYERFAVTFQESLRRLVVGGMHIHAGFGDSDSRIRVMTALRRYLPLLHALSTSSPFTGGRETGFKSYRLTIMGAIPRTNLPGPLSSQADFDRIVGTYKRMKFIESASLVGRLMRLDRDGRLPAEPPTEIIAENRWLAQRYGVLAFFGDEWSDGRVDIEDYAAALVEQLTDDARALGCEPELRGVLGIIRDGTGADRQIDHFRLRRLEGDTDEEALRSVVDLVVAETREGIAAAA